MTRTNTDPETRAGRLRLAAELADGFDDAQATALRVAAELSWAEVPAEKCGRYAGGPPALAARLYTPPNADWPRVRIAVQGSDERGYKLVTCLKSVEDGHSGWETIALPRCLLGAAGQVLIAAGSPVARQSA